MDELSWMGGLFDGEGCVGLYVHANRAYVTRLVVTVSNTRREALEPFVQRFGGSVKSYPVAKAHYKQLYRWYVVGRTAYEFLKGIRPCLRLKAEEADAAIRFWELPWRTLKGNQSVSRTQEQKAIDLNLARSVKEMKRASGE